MRPECRIFAVLLALAVTSPAAVADVYKYIDERGMVIFSTVALPGKTPISVIGLEAASSGRSPAPTPSDHILVPSAKQGEESRPARSAGTVYKYRDQDGNLMLSTVPLAGKTPVEVINPAPSLAGSNAGSAPTTGARSSAPGEPSSASSGEPSFKVASSTQHGRDDLRRTILQDELANEQGLLAKAATYYRSGQPERLPEEVANPGQYDDRVKRLGEEIRIHNSNIAALQRELSRVK